MNNSRDMAATIAGALIGGLAGYLFFTDRGRSVRQELEWSLEKLSREIGGFERTVHLAAGAVSEGWKVLDEALGSSRMPGAVN